MIEKTNNHAPVVSIGMPVYNGEKYIREALDSLLAQTFTDFELIISDNCSNDATENICREYALKDIRVKYIRQAENIGANANFKFLLENASSEFFMWAAHDDYLESNNYLLTMVNKMRDGYDFCFPNVKLQFNCKDEKSFSADVMNRFSNSQSIYDYCLQTIFICSYQIYGLFRRKFLIENYKYIDQCKYLRCYGEGLFVHAIMSNSSFEYIPTVNLVYRRHQDNVSSTQKINHLLIDLVKFTFLLLKFYFFHKKLTFFQKVIITKNILYLHLKHALILVFPTILKKRTP